MSNDSNKALVRVQQWLVLQMSGRLAQNDPKHRSFFSPWQYGCPEIIPGLTSKPVWDTSSPIFDWVCIFESSMDIVKEELLSLRGQPRGFQQYRAPKWASSSSSSSSSSAAKDMEAPDGLGSVRYVNRSLIIIIYYYY